MDQRNNRVNTFHKICPLHEQELFLYFVYMPFRVWTQTAAALLSGSVRQLQRSVARGVQQGWIHLVVNISSNTTQHCICTLHLLCKLVQKVSGSWKDDYISVTTLQGVPCCRTRSMNSLCIVLTLTSKIILIHRNTSAEDLDSNLKFTTIVNIQH